MVQGSALATNATEPSYSGFRSLVESNGLQRSRSPQARVGLDSGANMGGIGKPHVFEVFDHGIHSNQSC